MKIFRFCKIVLIISIVSGLGCFILTGCMMNEVQRPVKSQTIVNQKSLIKQEPALALIKSEESDVPPSPIPKKRESREKEYKWFSGRLKKKIREREKEINLQPIENLPKLVSEIRLWYFSPFEKISGIIFSGSNDFKAVELIKNDSKEEIVLDKSKLDRLRWTLKQSKLEKLKDLKTVEFTPSPDESYIVFQIKSRRNVNFKIYPASVGTNIKPTEPSDACNAVGLCREISELLSLDFNDCRCSTKSSFP